MPTYVVLSRLTSEGRKTIKTNPDRIKEVNKELEEMGAEIVDQYAVFGRYDFVNILKVSDIQTMAKISVEMGSRGSVQLETLRALKIDELIKSIKK
ncbi:GYD domain superfamily [candidate division MSBL1 archaeon SCGC-AAA833F18]|uniref:GYD domain superfamily n=1 Tax=candidate division MSBL1 archaeon SCGC-AAA833F18 TaxID=1698257 RepID=A0A133VRQ3_9EURY|nr:GYD domain superfamily [candidate division MSBL1 archaeon SCGC-AAA833F18]